MYRKLGKYNYLAIAVGIVLGGTSSYGLASAEVNTVETGVFKSEEHENLKQYVKVSEENSKTIALKAVPGTVKEVELRIREGMIVYDVEVLEKDGTFKEIFVDAVTGNVVTVKEDDKIQEQKALAKYVKITQAESKTIALKNVSDTVREIELEVERGTIVYKVEVTTKAGTLREVLVDAVTGDVVNVKDDDKIQEQKALAKYVKITQAKSKTIALKNVSGTVREIELEVEHGTIVYKVKVMTKAGTLKEVLVDAVTGKVFTVEEDDKIKVQEALAKYVKITQTESKTIALKNVSGTVREIELEVEHGTVIYNVEVITKEGIEKDVLIDAVTGKVITVKEEDKFQEQKALAEYVKITKSESENIALKNVSGTVREIELEVEHGTVIYKVEVITKEGIEKDVLIDAVTGKVITVKEKEEDRLKEQKALEKYVKITQADSKDIALKEVLGTIKEIELEVEHGTIVYKVEVITKEGIEKEVLIDSVSGKIVKVETDDKGKHEHDDKDKDRDKEKDKNRDRDKGKDDDDEDDDD